MSGPMRCSAPSVSCKSPSTFAGDRAVTGLAGELDLCVEQEFIDAVHAATSTPGLVRLTLDVAALTQFRSSGVRCLLLARESAIGLGVQFMVATTSKKSVRRTLDIVLAA